MNDKPNEVALPSLATFQLDLTLALSEKDPERLMRLYETKGLLPFLRQQETRFMQLALNMKKADPTTPDWKIEEAALVEVMLQEDPEAPPQEDLNPSPSPMPDPSKIAEILEYVRNSD